MKNTNHKIVAKGFVQTSLINLIVLTLFILTTMAQAQKVELLEQSTVTQEGLYFWYPNGKKSHDYAPNISPRGDCFTVANGYIFFGWYKGGMAKRDLMISRKKIGSGKWITVQLPHKNTLVNEKYVPTPYPDGLGNSHQTVSVGVSKKDNSLHIFFDHHNDPLNYIISKKGKAFVSDNQFTSDIFEKKRGYLAPGQNIRVTYPELTENDKGDLIVNYRVGTSHGGNETVHSYDGVWTRAITISQGKGSGIKGGENYAYGTPVFANGQFYYAFSVRWDNNKALNEGIYLAKCGPNFTGKWEDPTGKKHSLPIKDFSPFLIDDPATENNGGASAGVGIAVSENGDVHLSYKGRGRNSSYYYTYVRKAGENKFTKRSGFAKTGVAWGNRIYNVSTSSSGIITIESTPAGSINYRQDFRFDAKKKFGNSEFRIVDGNIVVIVEDRSNTNTDKQPIYSYVFSIDGGGIVTPPTNQAPTISVTSPSNNEVFTLGDEISLAASASDPDGTVSKVNFKIDDAYYKQDTQSPYNQTFTPTAPGTYKIAARAFDNEDAQTEDYVTVIVNAPNEAPTVTITSPANNSVFELGEEIPLSAIASDPEGRLEKVNFKIDGDFYKIDTEAPYENTFIPTEVGTYIIGARAFDEDGGATEVTVQIQVELVTGQKMAIKSETLNVFPNPSVTGIYQLSSATNFKVYSATGVYLFTDNNSEVDLSDEPKGIYLLKVENNLYKLIK